MAREARDTPACLWMHDHVRACACRLARDAEFSSCKHIYLPHGHNHEDLSAQAQSINCSKRVDQAHDTCSVFCRKYIMLSSEQPLVECRRFCQIFDQCKSAGAEWMAKCEAERQIPQGNTILLGCSAKCGQRVSNSNFKASCTATDSHCNETGMTSNAVGQRHSVTASMQPWFLTALLVALAPG